MERAAEILQEALREALRHESDFDSIRSAAAWVRGIAARLLLARRRAEFRARRCVPATVLGDEAWLALRSKRSVSSADGTIAARMDLELR
jgi:DNA-directed RNA polymerase specialized sigma24 family protein